jgi:DNA repair protein RadC
MNLKAIHPVDRPREKLIKNGASRLKDEELLAIIINTGTKNQSALEIAKNLTKKYTLADFIKLEYSELTKIKGINEAKACKIIAIKEILNRSEQNPPNLTNITDSKSAAIMFDELKNERKEKLIVLYLDIHNRPLHKEIITVGTVESTLVHPREIFEPAVRFLASSIIIAHNHPSGELEPSESDIHNTQKINEAGKIMGIELLDHLIISKKGYYSFADQNNI